MGRPTRYPYVQSRARADGTLAHRGYADDADGKRTFGDTFDDPYDAHLQALEMRGEAKNRAPAYTLDEGIEQLKDELRTKRTKGTLRWYSDHLRAVCELIPGDCALHSITAETVEQFIKDRLAGKRRVKAATVNADLRALHRVFAIAIRRGVLGKHARNPVHGVDRPRADVPAMDWFTDAEFRDVLAKVKSQRTRDILLLMVSTGVRRSEAARIEPGHVRLNLGQLIVPGKNRTRAVPLSADVREPLKRLLAAAKGPFLIAGGVHAIDDLFRAAKEETGDRRLHPHSCRHTFCTALIRSGVRPDVVMRLADHRSITTTQRYVHEVGDEGEKAVRLLRFSPPAESGPAATE